MAVAAPNIITTVMPTMIRDGQSSAGPALVCDRRRNEDADE